MNRLFTFALAALLMIGLPSPSALAQAPPPPPLQPLPAPPIPAGNPQSTAKINLGKTLFWEEQLSVTGTVACGTCHRPVAAGADPRSVFGGVSNANPGADNIFGTADDVRASAGVPVHGADGYYQFATSFGLNPQVGGRKSMSAINAAYSPLLFWDGRAGTSFSDPVTGQVLLAQGGALENQALGPLLNTVEMANVGAAAAGLANRITRVRPLALASGVPADLGIWINGRDYPALFNEVFGSAQITAARIALAMASYERTLFSTQTPFDSQIAGTPSLTALEQQGQQVFVGTDCAGCHAGSLVSDDQFHYIGLRPNTEDAGRFGQTGNPQDQGAFKTPSLRNVELRAPYMHNGRFSTLDEVVEFYNRGGDFNAPNKDPRVRPRNLSPNQKAALLAFLRRPLTDARVGAGLSPFDRPSLFSESTNVPVIVGSGVAGSAGIQAQIGALEPPLLGNSNFTVSVARALGGAVATLVVGHSDPGVQSSIPSADFASIGVILNGNGSGNGYASVQVNLDQGAELLGQTLYGRFYIADPAAANGLAVTAAFKITVFGEVNLLFRDGME